MPEVSIQTKVWQEERTSFLLLFNSIPPVLREFDDAITPDVKDLGEFKKNLDEYLLTVPDDPTSPQTNSLLHESKKYKGTGFQLTSRASKPGSRHGAASNRASAANRWKTSTVQSRWDSNYSGM